MAASPDRVDRFYAVVRGIARFWLWFFWKRVDVRAPERVPPSGPVLLCINHPNNLIDSLLVGAVLRRKVHYLATSALFRNPLVARFLTACGAMPVYRKQDDPGRDGPEHRYLLGVLFHARARAAHRHLPGGHDAFRGARPADQDGRRPHRPRVRGAAAPRAGASRSPSCPSASPSRRASPSAGACACPSASPSPSRGYLAAYRDDPVKAVDALTTAIQWAMEAEIVHVSRLDRADLVRVVEELYRGDLVRELQAERGLGDKQIDTFRLSQSIADAVAHFEEREPERVERIARQVGEYRAMLAAYQVRDQAVRTRLERPRDAARASGIPGRPPRACRSSPTAPWSTSCRTTCRACIARRIADKETSYATTRFLAAIVAFPLFWGLETWIVWRARRAALGHRLRGLAPAERAPRLSLPRAAWDGSAARVRFGVLALTRHAAASRLLAARRAIIAELDRAKTDYLAATRGSTY